MRFVERPPVSPVLAPFVKSIWYFSGELPHERERILPSATMQLLINLDQDELRSYHGPGYATLDRIAGAGLMGAYARHFAIDTAEQRSIAGVVFHPGGAFPFFRASADATSELHVGLDDLWGRDGVVVREQLLEAGSEERVLRRLEHVLLARAARPLEHDPVVAFATRALERGATVAAVMDRVGMSTGRFIRHFTARIGLTPKRYARVRRFQRVLAQVSSGPVDWAGVASACGYFDQAHLIRDFRAFAGVSPTAYRPRGPGEAGHMVLDGDDRA